MKKLLLLFGCLLLVLLVGCVQTDIVVHIQPNGSGTIEETVLMSKQAIAQMGAMMGQMSGVEGAEVNANPASELFNEDKLKAQAGRMGKGVAFVSSKKIDNNSYEGYKAIFSFKNINDIQIDENPAQSMPSDMAGGSMEMDMSSSYIRFQFVKGNPSKLIVRKPMDKESESSSDEDNSEMSTGEGMEGASEMAKMFLKGLKLSIAIDVDGKIVKTNATHRDGSKITLMEMDFDKILENPEKFDKLNKAKPKTMAETMELMKDVPGIKADLNDELVIEFK